MPMIMTHEHLHKKYVCTLQASGEEYISLRHFQWLFQEYYSHMKFPQSTHLGTCTTCTTTNDSIANKKMTRPEREKVKANKKAHLLLIEISWRLLLIPSELAIIEISWRLLLIPRTTC